MKEPPNTALPGPAIDGRTMKSMDQAAMAFLGATDWADAEARMEAVDLATRDVCWMADALAVAVARADAKSRKMAGMDWAEKAEETSMETEARIAAWNEVDRAEEWAVAAYDAEARAEAMEARTAAVAKAGEVWAKESVDQVAKAVAKAAIAVRKAMTTRIEAENRGDALAWAETWSKVGERSQCAEAKAVWAHKAVENWSEELRAAVATAQAKGVWYGYVLNAKHVRASVEHRVNETAKAVDEVRKAADEATARHS